jgi:hypothetical protein
VRIAVTVIVRITAKVTVRTAAPGHIGHTTHVARA